MDSVKFATGPLLIEIERANNESIGLVLTNKPYTDDYFSNTPTYLQASPESAIYVESIIPASIADR